MGIRDLRRNVDLDDTKSSSEPIQGSGFSQTLAAQVLTLARIALAVDLGTAALRHGRAVAPLAPFVTFLIP